MHVMVMVASVPQPNDNCQQFIQLSFCVMLSNKKIRTLEENLDRCIAFAGKKPPVTRTTAHYNGQSPLTKKSAEMETRRGGKNEQRLSAQKYQ